MLYTKLRNIATGATNGVVFDKNTNPLSLYGQTMVINSLSETVEVSHYQTATFSFGGTHRSFAGRLRVNNLSPVNAGFGSVSLNRQDTNNAYLTATGLFTLNDSTGEFTYGYTGTGVALNQIGFSLGSDLKTVPYVAGDEITFDQFDFNAGTASGNPFYLHPNITFNLRDGGHNTAHPNSARGREYGIPYFPINSGSYPGTVDVNRFLNTSFLGTTNLVATANPVILNTDVWKIKLYADKHEFLVNNVLKYTTDYKVSYTFHSVDNSNTEITDYTATHVSVSGSQFISVNPTVSFTGLAAGKYRLRVYNQEGIAAFSSRDFFFLINTSAPTCTVSIKSNVTPVNISIKAIGDEIERFVGQTGTDPIIATYRPVTGQGNVCYKITVTDPGGICATSITTTCPPDKPCVISTGGDLLKTKVYADNGDEAVYASIVNNADAIPTITFDGGITWDGTMQVVDSNGVIIVQGVFAGAYYNNGGTYFEINNKEIRIFSDDYPDFPEVGRTFFIRIVNQTNKNCYLEYPFVIPPFDCPPPSNTVWTITQPACNTNAGATTISIPALFGSQTEVLFELNNQTDFNGNNASYNLANSPYWNNTTKVLVLPYNLFVPNSTNTIHLRRLGTGGCYYDYTGSFVVPDCGGAPTAKFNVMQPICVANAVGNVSLLITDLVPSSNIKVLYCYNDTGTSFDCNKNQTVPDFTVNASTASLTIPPPTAMISNLVVRLYGAFGMLEKSFLIQKPLQSCTETCYTPIVTLEDKTKGSLHLTIDLSPYISILTKSLVVIKNSQGVTVYNQLRNKGLTVITGLPSDTYTVEVSLENAPTCKTTKTIKIENILDCDLYYISTSGKLYRHKFSNNSNTVVKDFGNSLVAVQDCAKIGDNVYINTINGNIYVYNLTSLTTTLLGSFTYSTCLGTKNSTTLIHAGVSGLFEIDLLTNTQTFKFNLPLHVKSIQGDIVYRPSTNSVLFTYTHTDLSAKVMNLRYDGVILHDITLPTTSYWAMFKYLSDYYVVNKLAKAYKIDFTNLTAILDNSITLTDEPIGASQDVECYIDNCIKPTFNLAVIPPGCSGLISTNAVLQITGAVNGNKVRYCFGDTFTCNSSNCNPGDATILSGSANISISPGLQGTSFPVTVRVYNTVNGDCDCYTDKTIIVTNIGCNTVGTINVTNVDFIFDQPPGGYCGVQPYRNIYDIYLENVTAGTAEVNQRSSFYPTYNRFIPTFVDTPSNFVASGTRFSCGEGLLPNIFHRFQINNARLRAAYPAFTTFTFDVYIKRSAGQTLPPYIGKNYNEVSVLINTFADTSAIKLNYDNNGVDFSRNPGVAGNPEIYKINDNSNPGFSTQTNFTKVGTVVYNTTLNLVAFVG